MRTWSFRGVAGTLLMAAVALAQQPPPRIVLPPGFGPAPSPGAKPAAPQPQAPKTPSPAAPAGAPAQPAGQTKPPAAAPPPPGGKFGGLNLRNASLPEVIDFLARQLGINYILDQKVQGGVTLNTYGETKDINPRELLDTILRINGFGMVQQGNIYRIVPVNDLPRMSMPAEQSSAANIPEDDRPMLNLVFLKYATVEDLAKLLDPFLGPGGKSYAYPPANLLLVLDTRRNMKRLMELVALFDSDSFARQRVRLFEVEHGRPTDIARELEGILKSISLSDKSSPVRLMPINRINTLVAVAPNPGVFDEVERWIKRLDVVVKNKAGSVDNYVYRVKYGQADCLSMAIMQLYLGLYTPFGGMGMMGMGMMGMGMGMSPNCSGGALGGGGGLTGQNNSNMGGYGGGMYGGGMYGGGMYGGGMYGAGMYGGGMYPGAMYGGGMYGAGMYGGGMYPGAMYGGGYGVPSVPSGAAAAQGATAGTTAGTAGASPDLTGQYLGAGGAGAMGYGMGTFRFPRVVPNPMDNSLLIQATSDEYEGILKLLRALDVPPRQVLIEAKIYEITLTGALSGGVQAYLQRLEASAPAGFPSGPRQFQGSSTSDVGLSLTAGMLVGHSRQLLAAVTALEDNRQGRIISAPSVIATDSIAATITVGTQVPTLSSSSVSPVQSGGNSLFANTIQNQQSGVTLSVIARVNPSGIVTLAIKQDVSAPVAPTASDAIQSPSFTNRNVTTQVTVQDGDTIAIGGIIQETDTVSTLGVPVLSRIPGIGPLFGSKSTNKERTELVVFMTPRVIYDTNEVTEASEELKSGMRRIQKILR